jgi:putative chitinase
MPTTRYPRLTDDDVGPMIAALGADGVTQIDRAQDPDGTWTLIATVDEQQPAEPPPAAVDAAQMKAFLKAAMDEQGITDPSVRAGIAAIAGGESGFRPRSETGYGHTDVSRIRALFGSRVANFSDEELEQLATDDQAFFNTVYGGDWGRRHLGNINDGDGYNFRGRGIFQLTGRDNYARYGQKIDVDLVTNPDSANDPATAAKIAVAYIMDRYHGVNFADMKRSVGNSVGAPDAIKNQLYQAYLQSGEFAVT